MTAKCYMLDPDCFEYHESFLDRDEADLFLALFHDELNWRQQEITLFGRQVLQPRLIAWYGDPEARYTYSGLTLEPQPWHPALYLLKERLQSSTGSQFNSVLANAYRNGRDSMGWHRDDEAELGETPLIASLSLGAVRRFLVKARGGRSKGLDLHHGSLLIMKGPCQSRFQHSLPKTRRSVGFRINLTFREIGNENGDG